MTESAKAQDLPEVRALVHGVNIVCESRRHRRTSIHRHVRRHSSGGCTGIIVAQLADATGATLLFPWLVPALPRTAERVVMPRAETPAS